MMRGIKLSLVSITVVSFSYSQEVAVDSKGEPVFLFYSKEDARFQFSRRSPLSASYLLNANESGGNMVSGTLVQLSLLNSGDFPLFASVRNIRPGAGIRLGYQRSIQSLAVVQKAEKQNVKVWGINALFSIDNIKLYDTIKHAAGKRYPFTYGVEGNYTVFFKSKRPGVHSALGFYSSLTSTWNDRNLLSYQEVSRVTFRPDIVAMADFDGRFGILKKNFLKCRMAASYQMYYGKVNTAPYLVAIFGTQNSPSYHMGVFTNLLSSSLSNSDNRMPACFGFGFDWVYAVEHLSPKINVFVKASVSLGKL